MIPTITLIIQAPEHGGRVVFESVTDEFGGHESRLVFGGDVEQTDKYIAGRNAKLDDEHPTTKEEPLRIEAPVKVRVRKAKEPLVDPLALMDAMDAVDLSEAG